jgi:uncharacterized membrane-anchored protein
MTKKILLRLIQAVAVLLPFVVIIGMVAKHEHIFLNGKVYRLKTAPVDPFDAFRGRYLRLQYQGLNPLLLPRRDEFKTWTRGQTLYLDLIEDKDGFATVRDVTAKPVTGGSNIALRLQWAGEETKSIPEVKKDKNGKERRTYRQEKTGKYQITFQELPFARYYLPEKLAARAEEAYQQRSARRPAVAEIRVLNGTAVLVELTFDGKPLRIWLEENEVKR